MVVPVACMKACRPACSSASGSPPSSAASSRAAALHPWSGSPGNPAMDVQFKRMAYAGQVASCMPPPASRSA